MRAKQLRYALLSLILMAAPCLGQSGLLAHFPCDEGSGNVTKDAVGGLTATLHGATWVKSGEGHCLKFDGEGAYVECPPAPALSPQEDISLAVWVRPEKIPAVGEPGIVAAGIGEALITTASGLIVAIPCFIAYSYFVSRVNGLGLNMELTGAHFLNLLTEGPDRAAPATDRAVPATDRAAATGDRHEV